MGTNETPSTSSPPAQPTKRSCLFRFFRAVIICFIGLFIFGSCLKLLQSKQNTQGIQSKSASSTNGTTSTAIPSSHSAVPATIPAVPAELEGLYAEVKSDIDTLAQVTDRRAGSQAHPVIFGTELLVANSNRGTDLLSPIALEGTKLYLDRLKELGIQGVTISINYPLFTPGFPSYDGYLQFYRQVVAETRKRGMKLAIESGFIFASTDFSKVPANYRGTTQDQLNVALHQMDQTIISEFSPDYLNIGGEPDSAAKLTGIKALDSVPNFTALVKYRLAGLNKGSTLVGAGGSTWGSTGFSQSLAENTSVDFIDLHIYPLNKQIVENISATIDIARQHNKKLVLDETWLYKAAGSEMTGNVAATENIFRRDAFSFWQPLDKDFLRVIAKLARTQGIDYVSPFWTNYFFAYIDYNDKTKSLSYSDVQLKVAQEAVKNLQAGTFTQTGQYYGQLISGK